jgi:hypothetical protein
MDVPTIFWYIATSDLDFRQLWEETPRTLIKSFIELAIILG